VTWAHTNRCPTGPGQRWPGSVCVCAGNLEPGSCAAVSADLDWVDERGERLLDLFGASFGQRVPRFGGVPFQFLATWRGRRRGSKLHLELVAVSGQFGAAIR
jgi:hypothetical protein